MYCVFDDFFHEVSILFLDETGLLSESSNSNEEYCMIYSLVHVLSFCESSRLESIGIVCDVFSPQAVLQYSSTLRTNERKTGNKKN